MEFIGIGILIFIGFIFAPFLLDLIGLTLLYTLKIIAFTILYTFYIILYPFKLIGLLFSNKNPKKTQKKEWEKELEEKYKDEQRWREWHARQNGRS